MEEKKDYKLINYLNYKDILIIFGMWYFIILIILIARNFTLNHDLVNNIFHFLFIVSGRFIFLGLTIFYLTSFYPISFKEIGFKLTYLKRDFFQAFSIILIFLLMIILIINIPLSFASEGGFSPLYSLQKPEDFVDSLLPLLLLFSGCLIIATSEQLILTCIIYELFKNTLFSKIISLLLTSLFYSIILLQFEPGRILLNFLVAFISLMLYTKRRSILAPSIFLAGYYSAYIVYIYGWGFINF